MQATQMKTETNDYEESKSKVFLISSDIIEDIQFWRRKRNECAHAKDTNIGHSHVEMFWLFLQSNIPKFVVNGGKASLLNKLRKHFDSKFTKPGTDFSYLIKEIPLVVRKSELPDLLSEIYNDYVDLYPSLDREEHRFWKYITEYPSRDLHDSFLKFITTDNYVFAAFMESFPSKLLLCKDKSELIRVFWKDSLFKIIGNWTPTFWDLAISLLTNELVPKDEQEHFVLRLSRTLKKGIHPDEWQTSVLKKYGLFTAIKEEIFVSGILNRAYVGYETANVQDRKIIYYLKNETLDKKVVQELNELFKSYTFGDLYRRLEEFIKENPTFLYEFREVAEQENITLADFFKKDSTIEE